MSEDLPADTDIRRLDPTTVERIAAGEVVERPASVVKELVENALDAGASRVEVAVDGDGTDRILVRDDGAGMTEADARAAVRQHTTSKIRDAEDLAAGLTTLGFRGEALYTIGAVSRLEIRTRPAEADRGTHLRYEGGDLVDVAPTGCPAGTTVEVRDLFYNTPAREKYLKREATEFAHVNRVVSRYALANPDVAVGLEHDDRETFSTTGRGDLRAAIMSVYGREVAEAMVPVAADATVPGADPDPQDLEAGPLTGAAGYVSHPETTRSSREYVTTLVNGRYVDADVVREAVLEAYGGQLAADRYPFAVLSLSVPPAAVDVNVHPRKMAVRFDDEDAVRGQVRAAVRSALLESGLVRSSAPRGRSAPDEVDPDPGVAGDREDASTAGEADAGEPPEGEYGPGDGETGDARAESTVGTGPGAGPGDPTGSPPPGGEPDRSGGDEPPDGSHDGGGIREGGEAHEGGDAHEGDERGNAHGPAGHGRGGSDGYGEDDGHDETGGHGESGRARGGRFEPPGEQRTLAGETATPAREYDSLPRMRVLGQYDDTYLVAESPDGLLLVDQHAADERVNYERLRSALDLAGDGPATQRLAAPVEVSLTAGEAATFAAAREALSDLGFRASLVDPDGADGGEGGRTLRVSGVPAVFGETVAPERLREVIAATVSSSAGESVAAMADAFLADLACAPAVTANTALTEGSTVELLSALDDCENPYACPHGRPTVVEFDREEVEARFERDYPGHGARREP